MLLFRTFELIIRNLLVTTSDSMHVPYIIVAEDCEYNQLLFGKMLQQLGYTSDCACDGEELIRLLRTSSPDLILLDIEMPVMNGFEAIRQIREGNSGTENNIPIIALTGYDDDSILKKINDSGFSDYLSKPVTRKMLKEKIDLFLNPG
jgi:CheY-like chemotaxis protein